jgi:hypothetical protein
VPSTHSSSRWADSQPLGPSCAPQTSYNAPRTSCRSSMTMPTFLVESFCPGSPETITSTKCASKLGVCNLPHYMYAFEAHLTNHMFCRRLVHSNYVDHLYIPASSRWLGLFDASWQDLSVLGSRRRSHGPGRGERCRVGVRPVDCDLDSTFASRSVQAIPSCPKLPLLRQQRR